MGLILGGENSSLDMRIPQNPKVLHFAPEKCIAGRAEALSKQYSTADFMRSDVDMQLDMSNMVGVPSCSYDLVIVIDVLEHVQDDIAALSELHRVLSQTGVLLLSVPQVEKEYAKWEDPSANTPDLRYHAYGQNDHVRLYGRLFPNLLEDAGYVVRIVEASTFESDIQNRHVLAPPILSNHPHATNVRRLFVCTKKEYNAS